MNNLRRRFRQYCDLQDDQWQALEDACHETIEFPRGVDVICAGDPAEQVYIVTSGWLIRYRELDDARRQITNFMLPGDIFDLQALGDLDADHSVRSLTKVSCITAPNDVFLRALYGSASLVAAFWWAAVQEESILRQQIVRVGRLSAQERIGQLLLELRRRLTVATGEPETEALPLPVTRSDIADATGLTPVHVSRTMSAMRKLGVVEESQTNIRIVDREGLAAMSQYDPDYLHLGRFALDRFAQDHKE